MANAAVKTIEVPIQASPHELEPAWQTRLGTTWMCRTDDPLDVVLGPGYFDTVVGHGLRVNDVINVVSIATRPASHAMLAIDGIRPAEPGQPRVITRILQKSIVK